MKNYKNAIFFTLFIISVIFEVSVLPAFMNPLPIPNLPLVFMIIWIIAGGYEALFAKIIIGGFFMDIIYAQPLGLNPLLLIVISVVIDKIAKRNIFIADKTKFSFGATLATVFFAVIFAELSARYLVAFVEKTGFPDFSANVFYIGLYSSMLFLLLYFPLIKLEKKLSHYDRRIILTR